MRILMLAPHPFYTERGSVIAVDLLLRALSERGDEVDLLTYHLGEERTRARLKIHRIRPWPRPASVRPGPSIAKLWCDLFMLGKALRMARAGGYDVIHAVEEAGFIAMLIGKLFGIPYVLDMDSLMSEQLQGRYRFAKPFGGLLDRLESLPMRRAAAIVPMCEDVAEVARRHCQGQVTVLLDVSLLGKDDVGAEGEDLRTLHGITGPIVMYIGNLEPYQGIDLLLQAFRKVADAHDSAALVIIGGLPADIARYREEASALGLDGRVHLVGPRPVNTMAHCMSQADVMVSPRIHGTNTPMKIYSYLDSGRPVVATNLPTHTQVMNEQQAALVEPEPGHMSAAILRLLDSPAECQRLVANASRLVQERHGWTSFRNTVHQIFDQVEQEIDGR